MNEKILLHICCAPCLCYPHDLLLDEGYNITGFWFNPNIHGYGEYSKRLMALGYYVSKKKEMEFFEEEYEPELWFSRIGGLNGKRRCRECYKLRIEKAVEAARKNSIENFTTTLLYSKFQNHEDIKSLAADISAEAGIKFIYKDFRLGWKKGIDISKKMGLYRQQYCGCLFSERERTNVS